MVSTGHPVPTSTDLEQESDMAIGEREIRNRFGQHPPTEETGAKKVLISEVFISFGDFLDKYLPDGRAKSMTFTKLHEAFLMASFSIDELSRDDELLNSTSKTSDNPTNKKV
jgi:hypothetical protein